MMRTELVQLSRHGPRHRLDVTLAGSTTHSTRRPSASTSSWMALRGSLIAFPATHPALLRCAGAQRSTHFLAARSAARLRRRRDVLPGLLQPPLHRTYACSSTSAEGTADTATAALPGAELPFWKSYISRKPLMLQALYDCLASIRRQGPLPGNIDVAMVYVSSEYLEDYGALVEALRHELPGLRNVFGCTGFGVIGVDEEGALEVEAQPALSLTLVTIPQAEVVVRHLDEEDLPDGDAPPDRWSAVLGVPAFPEAPLSMVVLSDPAFSAVQDLLAGLDFAFPTATKIGGLSSSSAFGGSRTATFCWSASSSAAAVAESTEVCTAAQAVASTGVAVSDAASSSSGSGDRGVGGRSGVYVRGAVVMSIHGEVQMDLIIAQGCRPLAPTVWTVDKVAAGNPTHVVALSNAGVAGGRSLPALEAFQRELQSVLSGMTEVQLRRTVANLTVGVAPEGLKKSLEPQDFLIRALQGFDSEQRMVVGEYMRVGQRVRFMVRDKQGAQEDLASHGLSYKRKQLQAMLQGDLEQQAPPFGMLIFTCNGRGSGLYGEGSYDARTMSSYVPVPCAGFQCNGEIGRVGDTTRLHGFTCAVGVLRLTTVDLLPRPLAAAVSTTTTTTAANAAAAAANAASSPPSSSSSPPPAPPPPLQSPSLEQPPDQQQQ